MTNQKIDKLKKIAKKNPDVFRCGYDNGWLDGYEEGYETAIEGVIKVVDSHRVENPESEGDYATIKTVNTLASELSQLIK